MENESSIWLTNIFLKKSTLYFLWWIRLGHGRTNLSKPKLFSAAGCDSPARAAGGRLLGPSVYRSALVPLDVLQEPSALIWGTPIYASARLASLGDTVMTMWTTAPPSPAWMEGPVRMASMTIPAPAPRDTMGRTAAPRWADANTAPATTGPPATKETTATSVSAPGGMVGSTASSCSPSRRRDRSSWTSPRSTQKARMPSSPGSPSALGLSWSSCCCWGVLLWSFASGSECRRGTTSLMPAGARLRPWTTWPTASARRTYP